MKKILIIAIILVSYTMSFAEYEFDTLGREGDSLALWAIYRANPKLSVDTTKSPFEWGWAGVFEPTGRSQGLIIKDKEDLFDSIPPEIGNFANELFYELNLSNNSITSLPPEIGNLTNLTTIDFSNNKLTSIPEEFGNLVNIETIYFNSNDIIELPESIINLKSINKFDEFVFYNNRLIEGEKNGTVGDSAIKWLNSYDPWWRTTQQSTIGVSEEKSFLEKENSKLLFQQTGTSIKFTKALPVGTKITVNTLNGKTVMQKAISGKSISLSHLAKGNYLLKIVSGDVHEVLKVDIW